MSQYAWDGGSFGTFVPNVFLIDDNGNLWFYEQNYTSFFPFVVMANVPTYLGNGTGQNLPAGTNLASLDNYAQYIAQFDATIINVRKAAYVLSANNILTAATQSPTALVENVISQALSGSGISVQQAVNDATAFLTNQNLNFGINDMLTGWSGGSAAVQQLTGLVNNLQSSISTNLNAVQSQLDFKRKLIGQVTLQADAVRKIQGQIAMLQANGTLAGLSKAFPEFSTVANMLINSNGNLVTSLATLVPQSLTASVPFLVPVINTVFGNAGGIPQICNPIDKILNDIQNLQSSSNINFPSIGFAGTTTTTPASSYTSTMAITSQLNTVNQMASLMNNVTATIPVVSQGSVNSTITDIEQMFLTANQYAALQLGQAPNAQNTAAINNINSLIAGTTAPSTQPNPQTSTVLASSAYADASQGGTLANSPGLNGALPTNNVYQPPINNTLSADPQIATNQNSTATQQLNATQANTTQTTQPGSCINNINDVPLKPRSTPVNGGLGTYNSTTPIPF